MGILNRFRDIMASNMNALLDKAEDPEKMIDQYLRDLQSDLGKVKSETATVMAEEQRAKRQLEETQQEMETLTSYAKKAVDAGNDQDARAFLEKKALLAEKEASFSQAYLLAKENAEHMKEMHEKLCSDMNELQARRDAIKSKMAVARAQDRVNQVTSSVTDTKETMSAFDRMEEKANASLDKANAMAELNRNKDQEEVDALKSKYQEDRKASIEEELAALKAQKDS